MINLDEFNKAEEMLKERGITYKRKDTSTPVVLGIEAFEKHIIQHDDDNGEWVWDFVCSTGTYGAEDGFLEYWSKKKRDSGDDVSGWLTAEEVIQLIESGE